MFAVVTSSQPKFTISEIMEDVQRAVRFIRSNAKQFTVRPDRLGVLGTGTLRHDFNRLPLLARLKWINTGAKLSA